MMGRSIVFQKSSSEIKHDWDGGRHDFFVYVWLRYWTVHFNFESGIFNHFLVCFIILPAGGKISGCKHGVGRIEGEVLED